MKILHALVGYLAVTALHFHPFAFASLAAIDHDGYVNTTQNHVDGVLMKHVLGNIVETCQTITTQSHKNNALMKRVPGDIIEARQAEIVIPILGIIVLIVGGVILKLAWDNNDNDVRGNNAEFLVEHSNHKCSRNVRCLPKILWPR